MWKSETSRYRNLVERYCQGSGLDLGSAGDPVVPWAIQLELPDAPQSYNPAAWGGVEPQLRGDARKLYWFADGVLDWVYSSHLLEDFSRSDWGTILLEWCRVVKPQGHLIILVPEHARWQAELTRGRSPNCAHQHEPSVGELTGLMEVQNSVVQDLTWKRRFGRWEVLEDRLATDDPNEYTILFVARRL